jgi:hypothetical protein
MAKIPNRVIPSDDCKVTVDGVDYFPHEGEQIAVRPKLPVSEYNTLARFYDLAGKAQDSKSGDEQEATAAAAGAMFGQIGELFEELCSILASYVLAWTWTDNDGEPLPQPKGRPEVIRELTDEELWYILGVAMGGSNKAQEKNGGEASLTTSSATA